MACQAEVIWVYISTSSIGLAVMGSQIVSLLGIKKRVGPRSHVTHSEQSNWFTSSASFNINPSITGKSESPKEGAHQVGSMQQLLALKPYNHCSPDAAKMVHMAHAGSPYSLINTLSHTGMHRDQLSTYKETARFTHSLLLS